MDSASSVPGVVGGRERGRGEEERSRRRDPTLPTPPHQSTRSRAPQSQSFSQSYASLLPTSLMLLLPSSRGSTPWRPAAVLGTALACAAPGFSRPIGSCQTRPAAMLFRAPRRLASQAASAVCRPLARKDISSRRRRWCLQVCCVAATLREGRNVNRREFRV